MSDDWDEEPLRCCHELPFDDCYDADDHYGPAPARYPRLHRLFSFLPTAGSGRLFR